MQSPDSHTLFYAYRHAKAAWDVVLYAPEYRDDDLPDEINDPLSGAHSAALNAFLMGPADNLADLTRKLRVFRDEEIADGWYLANSIVAQLVEDARRILIRGKEA